jgi:hypothetical protein
MIDRGVNFKKVRAETTSFGFRSRVGKLYAGSFQVLSTYGDKSWHDHNLNHVYWVLSGDYSESHQGWPGIIHFNVPSAFAPVVPVVIFRDRHAVFWTLL